MSQGVRNGLIALAAVILSIALWVGNSIRTESVSLESLAIESVPLEVARSNGKPSLVEFYADWCTTCNLMAPMLAELKSEYSDDINFVMLNVDNPKWLPELGSYRVNGIPHFVFMSATGDTLGTAIGEQPESILRANLVALLSGDTVLKAHAGQTSTVRAVSLEDNRQPDPRSHGATIPNSGATIPDSGAMIPDSGAMIPDSGATIPDSGAMIPDSGATIPDSSAMIPDSGATIPDSSAMIPDSGATIPDSSTTIPDSGATSPDSSAMISELGPTDPHSRRAI